MSIPEYKYKIVLVGDVAVGKTSLQARITDDIFNENYEATIGVDFKIKSINLNDRILKFQFWDTAGQERFRTFTNAFYHNATVILILFDITNKESYKNCTRWVEDSKKRAPENAIYILVATKIDISADEQQVDYENIDKDLKNEFKKYFTVSSKKNKNVKELFKYIIDEVQNIDNDVYSKDNLPNSIDITKRIAELDKNKSNCKC